MWLDTDENIRLEEGDIIFTPEKEERDWWEMFRQGLTVVIQAASWIAVVINVNRMAK